MATDLGMLHLNRSGVLLGIGRSEDALADCDRASRIFRERGAGHRVAQLAFNRSGALVHLGRLEEALEELDKARGYFDRTGDQENLARLAADRGIILAKLHSLLRMDPGSSSVGELSGERFRVFLRGAATEAALKHRPEVREAAVLHLACHGEADLTSPALSRLFLSSPAPGDGEEDGLVTLREMRDLSLRADLVVLSACETNAGRVRAFEGVAGLSRAALGAGALSVLSTLWQVGDEASASLVAGFYEEWLAGKRRKCQALAAAKRRAIERGLPVAAWSAYLLWDTGA